MDLFLAICQGLGLALATGVGGLLVPLFAAVLAHLDVGWNLDGTDWEFVGSEWFVALLFAVNLLAYLIRGRSFARPATLAALVALGAILFAASLAEEGEVAWPGLIAGAVAALGAAVVMREVLAGAGRRAGARGEPDAGPLTLFAAGAGLVIALASLLIPPVAIVVGLALIALAVARRRRADRKYEGLRVLR